ncbi:MAG TPA: hypothetical protein VGX23_24165 [Actinocrinis sp.]|nr:hypothetical protein [Actinocrinis sp.]
MKRRDWQALIQCRTLRETQALGIVVERRGHERQAADAAASAEAVLEAERRHQQAERQALYRSIQGRVLTPGQLLHMSERITEGISRTAAREHELHQAAAVHVAAQDATEAARKAHRARHQATERSRLLDRQLGVAEARRAEIHSEIEDEELVTLARLARGRDHA